MIPTIVLLVLLESIAGRPNRSTFFLVTLSRFMRYLLLLPFAIDYLQLALKAAAGSTYAPSQMHRDMILAIPLIVMSLYVVSRGIVALDGCLRYVTWNTFMRGLGVPPEQRYSFSEFYDPQPGLAFFDEEDEEPSEVPTIWVV